MPKPPPRERPAASASSSRLPLDNLPHPPPRLPTGRPRKLRRAALAFTLALTVRYIECVSALPISDTLPPGHDSSSRTDGNPDLTRVEVLVEVSLQLLQAISKRASAAVANWRSGDSHHTSQWATIEVARYSKVSRAEAQSFRMPGDLTILTQEFSPGFVVLSYLISFVGALCTLELLIRRTSNRGIYNILFLASAGFCFGSVSTFAMHFVGNQALRLRIPNRPDDPSLSLSYSGGFTVLSLVVSCLTMTLAFFIMGTNFSYRDWKSWTCVPGSRQVRKERKAGAKGTSEYNRWKSQKAKIRKSHNVSTIFEQAGIAPTWATDDTRRPSLNNRSWRDTLSPKARKSGLRSIDDNLNDKHHMKNNRELEEIEFRLGHAAVQDAIERQQHELTGSPMQSDSSIRSGQRLPASTPISPLAAYYPVTVAEQRQPEQSLFPTPSEARLLANSPGRSPYSGAFASESRLFAPTPDVFVPGYSFPPRAPSLENDSTTNLLIRPPEPAAIAQQPADLPLSHVTTGQRRASLPTLVSGSPVNSTNRLAMTLSRIQSLPEPGPDPVSETENTSGISSQGTLDPKSSPNSNLEPEGSREFAQLDELEDESVQPLSPPKRSSWRDTLRGKIQNNIPLTPIEKVERFLGLDVVTWYDVVKIFITGMVAGWGIAGMHYIGQVSINDIPYIAYRVGYVVGSVIIASGAVIIALYIMFIMLRPKLKHSWWSKVGVGIILAGAVCGMHYTAISGTIFGWQGDAPFSDAVMNQTKKAITGTVAALAFAACTGVASFIFINSIRDRKERARRRRVVVAAVLLDDQDRILVSAIDGLLPMCDIASLVPSGSTKASNKTSKRSRPSSESSTSTSETEAEIDLTTGNAAFAQALKMSWSWRNPFWSSLNPFASLTDLAGNSAAENLENSVVPTSPAPDTPAVVPLETSASSAARRGSAMTAAESFSSGAAGLQRANVMRFLERFAVAATQLSVRLTGQQEGVNRLGVLYDRILTTGWVRLRNSKSTVSKGQLVFLVRRVTSAAEHADLLSRHFIFAETAAVASSLHRTLSAPYDHVTSILDDMSGFCDGTMRNQLRPNTLYAGVVVVQATPFDGLRILLNQDNRSQLPMREICTFSTLPGLPVNVAEGLAGTLEEIGEAITWLEGMSLLSVITRNMAPEEIRVGGARVARLLSALERSVVPMLDDLLSHDDMAYILPRLTLHPVLVPLTPTTPARGGQPGWQAPHIIVFYANYDVAVNTFADKWLPFTLFRAQHECVMASKISMINRANEPHTPHASPAVSPSAAACNSTRRPSKVQFEVPSNSEPGEFPFPPRDIPSPYSTTTSNQLYSGTIASRDRDAPRRPSLKSIMKDDTSKDDGAVPDIASSRDLRASGVAIWDPQWLVHLLRTRLRAEAQ